MAHIDVYIKNYKGAGAALSDLVAGHVHFAFATAGSVAPLIKSQRLKPLAVTSASNSALFPGLPTMASSGLPGYETVSNLGIFAPAKTPAPIIHRLNQEIVRVLGREDIKEKFLSAGTEAVGSSPEQFASTIKSEMSRLGKVIREAHIRVE
jgi:tripartite-type tricarboxylate transporter receptor subunit TctC